MHEVPPSLCIRVQGFAALQIGVGFVLPLLSKVGLPIAVDSRGQMPELQHRPVDTAVRIVSDAIVSQAVLAPVLGCLLQAHKPHSEHFDCPAVVCNLSSNSHQFG
jgi:hypothetical protein